MKITIDGSIPIKKNGKIPVTIKGRTRYIINPETQKRIKEIINTIKNNPPLEKYPVSISMIFKVSNNRVKDLDGMSTTLLDCLVKAKIIKDDCIKYVNELHIYGALGCGFDSVDIVIAYSGGVK